MLDKSLAVLQMHWQFVASNVQCHGTLICYVALIRD